MANVGDWTLTVTGAIARVERTNVDKSGKNPKYFLTFVVQPTAVEGVPEGAEVPAEIPIRIKDIELDAMTKTPPREGDRVVMTAKASGARPSSFYLASLR